MAAAVRDMFLPNEPSELYFLEKTKSLRLLQEAISTDAIDESLFTSVILQIFIDFCMNNSSAIQRHLRGLYLIFPTSSRESGYNGTQFVSCGEDRR